MTATDQIKTLDRKIKQHHDLDRKVAKISALSSGNLDKYEDLNYKPSTVEQAKCDYSSLSKLKERIKRRRQKRRTFKKTKK